ncbi:MAG: hypothetical protein ACRCXT_06225 [Paraclostridium sp.]
MAFGDNRSFGNNNKKKESVSANTYGNAFYNSESKVDQSMLSVNFFSQLVELKFNPTLPLNRRNNGKVFDMENDIKIYIPKQSIRTLYKMYDRHCKADRESIDYRPEITIKTNKGFVSMGDGSIYNSGPYISLVLVDENGREQSSILHEFVTTTGLFNYNKADGTYEEVECENKVEEFLDILRETDGAFTMATAHSVKESTAWNTSNLNKKVDEMMMFFKIGNGGGSTGGGNKPARSFGGAQTTSVSDGDVQSIVDELENL